MSMSLVQSETFTENILVQIHRCGELTVDTVQLKDTYLAVASSKDWQSFTPNDCCNICLVQA